MYRKIYHHASNLLVNYRVKWQKCVGQRCWHDFLIKDVTVKQVTLNDNRYVTDMDKINIVGLQAVLKMSFFSMDTRWMSSSPLVNSLVKNRLFKTAPNIDEPPFQFIHTMDLSVVDTMLHNRSRNPQDWHLGCLEATGWAQNVWCFLTPQFNSCTCTAQCAGAVHCQSETTKLLPDTLRIAGISMTSLWRRETAQKKAIRDITRISCFVIIIKLLHALQICSTVLWSSVWGYIF